jgi:hypothetical protein
MICSGSARSRAAFHRHQETSPMALIQIPVQNHDHYPTAGINPTQVAAIYSAPLVPGGTTIELNSRDPQPSTHYPHGRARTLVSPAPVADVLAALAAAGAPLVPAELVRITASTPLDHHVNPSAIVAVRPHQSGTGHVWLTNGEELFVTPAALQALAALLVAPPAAVAAAHI